MSYTVSVHAADTDTVSERELPETIFGRTPNVALMHQVVTAQQAKKRQGTHKTKTRGEVRGGGAKPYRQKGTGRARQGSIRSPQFTGGGVVHGPIPRDYSQRTPKKMVKAALESALSDRAACGRIYITEPLVTGEAPSTKKARLALEEIAPEGRILLLVTEGDDTTALSARNLQRVHLLAVDQLNTYDVLAADHVVFTTTAYDAFTEARSAKVRNTKGEE